MSVPLKNRLAARIFSPSIPPRTHSIHPEAHPPNLNIDITTHPVNIQKPPPVAPSQRRSYTCQAPIIWNDREEKSGRKQTEESERAREEVLGQGIKVRDFQAEIDERKVVNGNTRGK